MCFLRRLEEGGFADIIIVPGALFHKPRAIRGVRDGWLDERDVGGSCYGFRCCFRGKTTSAREKCWAADLRRRRPWIKWLAGRFRFGTRLGQNMYSFVGIHLIWWTIMLMALQIGGDLRGLNPNNQISVLAACEVSFGPGHIPGCKNWTQIIWAVSYIASKTSWRGLSILVTKVCRW